jgi:hypothetical protein
MKNKCINCKNWYFNSGCSDFSDQTPGYDFSFECLKNHWDFSNNTLLKTNDVRNILNKIRECKDYKHFKGK